MAANWEQISVFVTSFGKDFVKERGTLLKEVKFPSVLFHNRFILHTSNVKNKMKQKRMEKKKCCCNRSDVFSLGTSFGDEDKTFLVAQDTNS